MPAYVRAILSLALCASALALAGCGGGSSSKSGAPSGGPGPTTYTVTASVSNLASPGTLVLQDNGGDNLSVQANGNFVFPTALNNGAGYDVSILTEPVGQVCTLSGAYQGTSSSAVTVRVDCTQPLYRIGGTIAGLTAGQTVVIQFSDGAGTTYTASGTAGNGSFTFGGTVFAGGTAYTVGILTQPSTGTCTVVDTTTGNTTGTVSAGSVSELQVQCT